MKVKEIITLGKKELEKSNIENPLFEAKSLFTNLLGKEEVYLITNLEDEILESELEKYKSAIKKRCEHMPFAYIVGFKEFMGLKYMVDENTLIPRPETEGIIEYILNMYNMNSSLKILEIGVGSGCISVTLAKYLKNAKIIGVDINELAIKKAEENALYHNVGDRVNFIKSDIYENIHDSNFDIIVSNPPYIASDIIETLEEDVKKYEPVIALDGGKDGMDFYKQIVINSKQYIKKGGEIIFEIGYDQGKKVKDLLQANEYKNVKVIKDLSWLDRIVVGEKE